MKRIALDDIRFTLTMLWLVATAVGVSLLVVLSLRGQFGENQQAIWSWWLPTILPTLSLMLGVVAAGAMDTSNSKLSVSVLFARLALGCSIFYLTVDFITLFALLPSIFTGAVDPKYPLEVTKISGYWLNPLQSLVVLITSSLFASKNPS